MSDSGRRCAVLVLCCLFAASAASPPAPQPRKGADVLRSSRRGERSSIVPGALSSERQAVRSAKRDASLVAAITELERHAQEVESHELQATFVERARDLLVLTSDVQIMLGRYTAALWFSDRARQVVNRTFASAPAKNGDDAERLGRELVESVTTGVTAIHQELNGDQLLTWVIRDRQVHFVATAVDGATLTAGIERFRTTSALIDAQVLYDVLVEPVRQHIGNATQVIYSPGPALRGVPFAALHDGESFLIEQHTIIVTPSLSILIDRLGDISTVNVGMLGTDKVLITLPSPAAGSAPGCA
jgi:CHAT domain-containing protein